MGRPSVAPPSAACGVPAASRANVAVVSLLLFAASFAVYFPVRQHDFVAFDDPDYVSENRMVQAGLTWRGVNWAFTTGHSSNWHPLTWLSHMLDVELFGPGPAAPHVINALLHAVNAVLVYVVLWKLTGASWRSVLAAALFALHPLRAESVAWISERKDVLSGCFFLLTLWAWALRGARRPRDEESTASGEATRSRTTGVRYAAALLFFALGLMCKPTLVTVPFVLLLLDWWPLRRFTGSGANVPRGGEFASTAERHTCAAGAAAWRPALGRALRLGREKLPFFALSAASCVITYIVQQRGGAVRPLAMFSLVERIGNAVVGYARYVGKTLWPVELSVFYPHPHHWAAVTLLVSSIVVIGASVAVGWYARRLPFAFTGWCWFLGMMVPMIGLVQVGEHAIADRYTYLPSIGLCAAIAWGAGEIVAWRHRSRAAVVAISCAAVAGCVWSTVRQVRHWRDSGTLFGRALALDPGNYVAHQSLGSSLLKHQRIDEAIVELETALRLRRGYSEAHNNLGTAWLRKGDADKAAEQFRLAAASLPGYALARYNLGTLLLERGQLDAAVPELKKAVELQPDDALSHLNLGNACLQLGRMDEALASYRAVLRLDRDSADAHCNIGNAMLQLGKPEDAIMHLEAAVRLRPDHGNAHFLLGGALAGLGRIGAAIGHYQRTVAILPDDAEARYRLACALLERGSDREALGHLQRLLASQPDNPDGLALAAWVLATSRDASLRSGREAAGFAERANRITRGGSPVVLRGLAAAQAENGRFTEAAAIAERAVRLARQQSNLPLAAEITAQLELYRSGVPCRARAPGTECMQPVR